MTHNHRRFLAALLVALAAIGLSSWAADAQEETVRRIAQEEGIDPDLAASVARCESNFRPDARNGQYRGSFQMSDGWGSVEERQDTEWASRRFADSVRAGSAPRHWRACWPGRGGGRRGATPARAWVAPPPTGTDGCDRESGEWRCYPSWTEPDALTVSPSIETDPGPEIAHCDWVDGVWTCDRVMIAQTVAEITPTREAAVGPVERGVRSWLWDLVFFLAMLAVVVGVLWGTRRDDDA